MSISHCGCSRLLRLLPRRTVQRHSHSPSPECCTAINDRWNQIVNQRWSGDPAPVVEEQFSPLALYRLDWPEMKWKIQVIRPMRTSISHTLTVVSVGPFWFSWRWRIALFLLHRFSSHVSRGATRTTKPQYRWLILFRYATFSRSSGRMASAWISSESRGRVVSDSIGPSRIGEMVFAPLPPPFPLSEIDRSANDLAWHEERRSAHERIHLRSSNTREWLAEEEESEPISCSWVTRPRRFLACFLLAVVARMSEGGKQREIGISTNWWTWGIRKRKSIGTSKDWCFRIPTHERRKVIIFPIRSGVIRNLCNFIFRYVCWTKRK